MRFLYIFLIFGLTLSALVFANPKKHPPELKLSKLQPVAKSLPINIRYDEIKNLRQNVTINSRGYKISAEIFYEKKDFFRMKSRNMDVGSNFDHFWFWSSEMEPPALFYAKHEHLQNTRLRAMFHPVWLKEFLGANVLAGDTFTYENQLAVATAKGKYTKICLLEKNGAILAHYLYKDKELLLSAKVESFHEIGEFRLPKRIIVFWQEENMSLTWNFSKPILNSEIDSKMWVMPEMKQKMIDLNGY